MRRLGYIKKIEVITLFERRAMGLKELGKQRGYKDQSGSSIYGNMFGIIALLEMKFASIYNVIPIKSIF